MGHDQLFKEVLQAHLQAFLELFFRDVAALLDFDSLRFEAEEYLVNYREVEEMEVTWADKMMEKGLKVGLVEGKRETLLRQLTAKFGPVSEESRSRVQALEPVAELDAYLERVLTANSIADMGL